MAMKQRPNLLNHCRKKWLRSPPMNPMKQSKSAYTSFDCRAITQF
ncbi:MAG: hypothetical protein SXG53_11315 [Pseudomonadota bacterium]|nr:hypothetical protein [Pseudomonadota bacterium]